VFLIAIPSALSKGASEYLTKFTIPFIDEIGIYDIMDFIWGSLGMVIGGLLLAIFTGWVWGTKHATQELQEGCDFFTWQAKIWAFIIKYLAPIIIFGILLSVVFGI